MGLVIKGGKGKYEHEGKTLEVSGVVGFQYVLGFFELKNKETNIIDFIAFPINSTPIIPRVGETILRKESHYTVSSIAHSDTELTEDTFLTSFVMIQLEKIQDSK